MFGLKLVVVFLSTVIAGDISGLVKSAPDTHKNIKLNRTMGSTPDWLLGALYRVGPGMFEYGGRSLNGVTDALGKIHSWVFRENGVVSYSGRMVLSNVYNKTISDGYYAAYPVAGDVAPDFSLVEEARITEEGLEYKDNTNIAVWNLDGGRSITVSAESPAMHQVRPYTVEYKGPLMCDYVETIGKTEKALFSASHFARHPWDGSSYNYVLSMSLLPWKMSIVNYNFLQYMHNDGVVSSTKIGSIQVPVDDMRMIHQLGITENYLVVPRFNYLFSLGVRILKDQSHLCNSIHFAYDKDCHIDVMSIKTGVAVNFKLPPQKVFHIINSLERINSNGELEVVMDVPALTDIYEWDLNHVCPFDLLKIPNMLNPTFLYENYPWNSTIRRFVLNMDTKNYTIRDFQQSWKPVDAVVDFPFINPKYEGIPYCFAYFQQWHLGKMSMDIMKYNLCNETAISWHEPGKHAMEPIFVPNPSGQVEDDGVIVSPVFDSNTNSTELVVLNAKDLNVLARYDNLVAVPFTVHGWWFDH